MKRLSLPSRSEVTEGILRDLYEIKKYSVARIAKDFNCSQNRVNYWIAKYGIKKRTISDAMYQLKNPLGDPFLMREPLTLKEGILFGLGLGLYWGEGTKRGKGGMRITNTDAKMMRKFIEFLETFFGIDRDKLRFSVLIFSDISENDALNYWSRELGVRKNQFYKTVLVKVRGSGTYKYRSEHGVVIVQFNNIKLKKLICDTIENIR